MPSFDVNLPKSVQPRWPERCLGCGREGPPESELSLWTHSVGWWTWILLSFGRPFRARIPVCFACKLAIRRQRWLRRIIAWTVILAAIVLTVQMWQGYQGPFRKLIILLCVLPVVVIDGILNAFWPPTVDITAFKDSVDYEFKDEAYAHDFATLNSGEVT